MMLKNSTTPFEAFQFKTFLVECPQYVAVLRKSFELFQLWLAKTVITCQIYDLYFHPVQLDEVENERRRT